MAFVVDLEVIGDNADLVRRRLEAPGDDEVSFVSGRRVVRPWGSDGPARPIFTAENLRCGENDQRKDTGNADCRYVPMDSHGSLLEVSRFGATSPRSTRAATGPRFKPPRFRSMIGPPSENPTADDSG
jgi:hypothetical protein